MARTSKKRRSASSALTDKSPKKIYSAGIYARLSVDSENKGGGQNRKNESIETQVEIAKEFISRQEDMEVYDCYTDMGKTGTDFEREGFARMMRDVRMRRIDCIVVKDLSRFGRNHIETGNYIEKIFPFMGVRFIAVTDNFDSRDLAGQDEALCMNLKNLVNEMYAKDIAVKVKSGKKAKWEQGSYTGGIPPYGYRAEWTGDKKCLFVEKITSDIVKKIFELFLSGRNMKEIIVWLYENGIARPVRYHKTGRVYCRKEEELEQWSRSTVKMMLTNPVYTGCLVQGRTCGKDYRLRGRHDLDSGDWSIKEHTHEAIISEEMFLEAAKKFEKNARYCNKDGFSKTVPPDQDIFAEVLYCGDCGAKMKRIAAMKGFDSNHKVRTYGYCCPESDRIDGFKCVRKSITLCTLTNIVKEAVRLEFSLSKMRLKELTESSSREAEALKAEWDRRFVELERKIKGITKLGSEQYLQYRMGKMEEACFRRLKEENRKKADCLQRERAAVIEHLRTIDAGTAGKNHFLRNFAKGTGKAELTGEAVRTLIDRIEVYPDHRVKVIFAFRRTDIFPGEEDV